jgi:hypothetical protein
LGRLGSPTEFVSIYVHHAPLLISILGEYLKTWFEVSVLKAGDPEINPYHQDLHPHDWFKSLPGDRPKLLNAIPSLDPAAGNPPEPQRNPFDERKRSTVMHDSPPDAEWHEITWNQENSDLVNELTVGDQIVLIARALVSLLPHSNFYFWIEISSHRHLDG